MKTTLWQAWSEAFNELRSGFSRTATFYWAAIFCAGMCVRHDIRGVSSIVSTLGLRGSAYKSLINLCHSSAIDLEKLLSAWIRLCLRIFVPACIDGYLLLIADGVKIGKEGKKMPAVKLMHQDSQSNAKSEYIMGHYLQAVSLVVISPLQKLAAIPLVAQIHDGLVASNRSTRTCISRLAELICTICDFAGHPAVLVADAYYASRSLVEPLRKAGCHLVCRVKHNTVANLPLPPVTVKKRGRPKLKGEKIKLFDLYSATKQIFSVSGDSRYLFLDLYWSPAQSIVRFVIVENSKGRAILMSTDTSMDAESIIKIYESRWMIETGFKIAKHQLGTFAYHFWMKNMKRTKRGQLKQFIHRESEKYRDAVQRKMQAYHIFIAFGCISQGLLIYLALNHSKAVWSAFSGWLRTIRPELAPSELVVSNALKTTLPNFLIAENTSPDWLKFYRKKVDHGRQRLLARSA